MATKRRRGRRLFDITEPASSGVTIGLRSSAVQEKGYGVGWTYAVDSEGSIAPDPFSVGGAQVHEIYWEQIGTTEFHVVLTGVRAQSFFTSVEVEYFDSGGGTVTFNTADATHSDDGTNTEWKWPRASNFHDWESGHVGNVATVVFT